MLLCPAGPQSSKMMKRMFGRDGSLLAAKSFALKPAAQNASATTTRVRSAGRREDARGIFEVGQGSRNNTGGPQRNGANGADTNSFRPACRTDRPSAHRGGYLEAGTGPTIKSSRNAESARVQRRWCHFRHGRCFNVRRHRAHAGVVLSFAAPRFDSSDPKTMLAPRRAPAARSNCVSGWGTLPRTSPRAPWEIRGRPMRFFPTARLSAASRLRASGPPGRDAPLTEVSVVSRTGGRAVDPTRGNARIGSHGRIDGLGHRKSRQFDLARSGHAHTVMRMSPLLTPSRLRARMLRCCARTATRRR